MTAIGNDITKPSSTRLCEFEGCGSNSSGKAARYCDHHRQLLRLRALSRLSVRRAEELARLEAKEPPPLPETPSKTLGLRELAPGEICPARSAYVDEIVARLKARKK